MDSLNFIGGNEREDSFGVDELVKLLLEGFVSHLLEHLSENCHVNGTLTGDSKRVNSGIHAKDSHQGLLVDLVQNLREIVRIVGHFENEAQDLVARTLFEIPTVGRGDRVCLGRLNMVGELKSLVVIL